MTEAAVLGYGTVGSGVVEVIEKNAEVIAKRCEGLHVKYILDLRDFPGDPYEDRLVHDVDVILSDESVKVVCETMGGAGAAYDFTKRALMAGKSVCTSNKELVELHGAELARIAKEHNCSYLFEASVGGGIPLIRTIYRALTAERIESIFGILNGTTNYILHRMELAGIAFDEALKEAQELGYAEKDPTADIEGHDPARKIAILASLVLGKKVDYSSMYMEGITKVEPVDMEYAKALGGSIKLVAMCEFAENGVYAMVSPRFIPKDNPLLCVRDVFNGVLIHSDMLDDSMYYGRGAGKLATASAVVGDAVECVNHPGKNVGHCWSEEKVQLKDIGDLSFRYLLRVKQEGAAAAEAAFGCEAKAQEGVNGETAFLTAPVTERDFQKKLADLPAVIRYYRV
ncbi:MAG: homoserine dehydrogenase [Lachnospiraceae bacterium]|nr:homoserine dehydrogenase [Lachnospiraceae bacterium]